VQLVAYALAGTGLGARQRVDITEPRQGGLRFHFAGKISKPFTSTEPLASHTDGSQLQAAVVRLFTYVAGALVDVPDILVDLVAVLPLVVLHDQA